MLTSGASIHRGELALSFGPDVALFASMLADQLDRVLRGANPAELPIRQPTVFEIVVNKRMLLAMGIALPPTVALQATEVTD